jgi:hypothetical protein
MTTDASSQPADLTTTQKLWRPISQLQAEAEDLGLQLRAAALAGDINAAKQAARRMEEIQREMSQAGQSVREHARQKALVTQGKSQPDKNSYPAIGRMLMNSIDHWRKTHPGGELPGSVSTATETGNDSQA